MKPVKNKKHSVFQVGHKYRYIADDEDGPGEVFTITSIRPCDQLGTCGHGRIPLCDHTVGIEEMGHWCGVFGDFREET